MLYANFAIYSFRLMCGRGQLVGVCRCICNVCVENRRQPWVSFLSWHPLFLFWDRISCWPGTQSRPGWLLTGLKDLPVTLVSGVQMDAMMSGFCAFLFLILSAPGFSVHNRVISQACAIWSFFSVVFSDDFSSSVTCQSVYRCPDTTVDKTSSPLKLHVLLRLDEVY